MTIVEQHKINLPPINTPPFFDSEILNGAKPFRGSDLPPDERAMVKQVIKLLYPSDDEWPPPLAEGIRSMNELFTGLDKAVLARWQKMLGNDYNPLQVQAGIWVHKQPDKVSKNGLGYLLSHPNTLVEKIVTRDLHQFLPLKRQDSQYDRWETIFRLSSEAEKMKAMVLRKWADQMSNDNLARLQVERGELQLLADLGIAASYMTNAFLHQEKLPLSADRDTDSNLQYSTQTLIQKVPGVAVVVYPFQYILTGFKSYNLPMNYTHLQDYLQHMVKVLSLKDATQDEVQQEWKKLRYIYVENMTDPNKYSPVSVNVPLLVDTGGNMKLGMEVSFDSSRSRHITSSLKRSAVSQTHDTLKGEFPYNDGTIPPLVTLERVFKFGASLYPPRDIHTEKDLIELDISSTDRQSNHGLQLFELIFGVLSPEMRQLLKQGYIQSLARSALAKYFMAESENSAELISELQLANLAPNTRILTLAFHELRAETAAFKILQDQISQKIITYEDAEWVIKGMIARMLIFAGQSDNDDPSIQCLKKTALTILYMLMDKKYILASEDNISLDSNQTGASFMADLWKTINEISMDMNNKQAVLISILSFFQYKFPIYKAGKTDPILLRLKRIV